MTTLNQWNMHLRHLRDQAGLTQTELIEQFSQAINTLSHEEISILKQANLYEEITIYLGEILDKPAWSKLETGKRTISSRKRSMAIVWGFRHLGAIKSIAEANQFLELGGFGHLTPTEAGALFKGGLPTVVTQHSPLPQSKMSAPSSSSPIESTLKTKRNLSPLPFLLGILALLAIGWSARLAVGNSAMPAPLQPTISESFSENELASEDWNTTDAPHAQIHDGQLLFDVPLNESEEWSAEYLKHYGGTGQISRIKYNITIDTPQAYESGSIGISTGCQDDGGFLNIFAGGEPSVINIEFPNRDEIEDWSRDVTLITVMPIKIGESYDIDLQWTGDVVELSVNGEVQTDVLIACNLTTYFNIMTSSLPDRKVRGFIDDLQVWY